MNDLEKKLIVQEEKNRSLISRNDFLEAEVEDLKNGKEAISEIARVELGYVQEGETYYRLTARTR